MIGACGVVYRSAGLHSIIIVTNDRLAELYGIMLLKSFYSDFQRVCGRFLEMNKRNLFISIYTSSGQLITTSESKVERPKFLTQHFSASHYPGCTMVRALTDRGIMTGNSLILKSNLLSENLWWFPFNDFNDPQNLNSDKGRAQNLRSKDLKEILHGG